MKLHSIPLNEEGIYLFKTPTKITAQLNRELLIVICAPSAKSCGAVFFSPESAVKELLNLLNALLLKINADTHTRTEHLRIKAFGMSTLNSGVHEALVHWAKEKKIEISVQDVGKNVVRHVYVECETGRVGVTYAEAFIPKADGWLLTSGSAQVRKEILANDVVLVLSQSTVNRQLARQAVEDLSGWQALIADRPFDWITGAHDELFPARAVVFFDDLGKGKPIEKWITNFRKAHPEVAILWVGNKPPRYAQGLQRLAPLKPQSLGKFKKCVKTELAKLVDKKLPETSEVIQFPTKARAKRR